MKVVILAGGFGTRLSEYTKTIPKPMINICGKPIITYIIKHYEKFGLKNLLSLLVIKKILSINTLKNINQIQILELFTQD